MVEQKLPKLPASAENSHPLSKTLPQTSVSLQTLGFCAQNKLGPLGAGTLNEPEQTLDGANAMLTISDAAHICRRYSYDPLTGALYREGAPAQLSFTANGYLRISANGRNHLAHRIAWLLHYETEPPQIIDHINGVKTDNRICNLRASDPVSNSRNSPMRANNTSGYSGVSWSKGKKKWRAKIGKQNRHLGYFSTFEEAVSARITAEREDGYHENHGRAATPPPSLAEITRLNTIAGEVA